MFKQRKISTIPKGKKKRKKGQGKKKGNNFENSRAKELSLWITKGERIDIFERSSSSGAKATMHRKLGRDAFSSQAGDIASSDPLGENLTKPIMIECKHYGDMNYLNLFFGGKGGVVQFWDKLLEECEYYKKYPMLVCRQNHRPILLGTNLHVTEQLNLHDFLFAVFPKKDLGFLLWSAFFENCDPNLLMNFVYEVR